MGREAQGLVVRTGADIVGVDFHRSLEYCTLTRDNIEGSRGTVTRLFLLKKEVQCPFEFRSEPLARIGASVPEVLKFEVAP